jgi:hypothetical protein
MQTMRVNAFHGPNDIRVEEVPRPIAGAGDAVIRITVTTICGTDWLVRNGGCEVDGRFVHHRCGKRSCPDGNVEANGRGHCARSDARRYRCQNKEAHQRRRRCGDRSARAPGDVRKLPALFASGRDAQQPRCLFGQTPSALRCICSGHRRLQDCDDPLPRREGTNAPLDVDGTIEAFRSDAAADPQFQARSDRRSLRSLRFAPPRRSESHDPPMKHNLSL